MSVQLRALTLDDCEPWADLLAAAFDRAPGDMQSLLQWLYAERELIAWGAWEDKQLIAQYCSLVTALRLPSTDAPECVGLSINMAVHPEYRGRGLVKHVAQPVYAALADRGGLAGVGFSNAAGVKVDRRSHAYGYRVIGRLQPRFVALVPRVNREPLCLTTEWPDFPFDFSLPADDLIRWATSARLLRHRFAQHPFRRYRFGVCDRSDGARGVVIYRMVRWRGLRGASLLAAYGNDVVDLLQRWAAALRGTGIYLVQVLTTPNSVLRTALHHVGCCVRLPYSHTPYFLTVKPMTASASSLLEVNRWDCSGGDIL